MKTSFAVLMALGFGFSSVAHAEPLTTKELSEKLSTQLKASSLASDVTLVTIQPLLHRNVSGELKVRAQDKSSGVLDSEKKENTSIEAALERLVGKDQWYPTYCELVTGADEDNTVCATWTKSLVAPIAAELKKNEGTSISSLYLNGDADGSDYKVFSIFVLPAAKSESALEIQFKIHDERD